jgi:hypothetical protein
VSSRPYLAELNGNPEAKIQELYERTKMVGHLSWWRLYLAGVADFEREGLIESLDEILRPVEGFTLFRSAGIMTG